MHNLHEVEAESAEQASAVRNLDERENWFIDLGLGMFIHWSLDSQLGSVISHSLVGASDDYVRRYIHELPKTFNPERFNPGSWARLARAAGMRYVMFTTKHHNGFCMWDTKTTDFNIMNTPFGKDITRELVEAFRAEKLAVGFYFSPEDFWFLHRQGLPIARKREECWPANNRELRDHNAAQLTELFSNYGPIDLAFLDGFTNDAARDVIWAADRRVAITRGVMKTPEQHTPEEALSGPWEANYTLGTQWQFKPTNAEYKSGGQLIRMLIEIRAKGGNFLLNVGPQPDGEIPFEQERRVRELALWMFVNEEAIHNVRPWHVPCRDDIWFTKAKDEDTLYAFLPNSDWGRGERKQFLIRNTVATGRTTLEVIGHNGRVVEYKRGVDAAPRFEQTAQGLLISVVRGQRLYNNSRWPNPLTAKLTHVRPA